MLVPRRWLSIYYNTLWHIKALDGSSVPITVPINPNFTIIIYTGLKYASRT
jgi:hypothetical protein